MNRFLMALVLLAATETAASAQIAPPRGFRLPTDGDFTGTWQVGRADRPTPYLAKADLNGDGREDEAWLFPATKGKGWALFVYLAGPKGTHQAWQLAGDRKSPAQVHRVSVVPPGRYETECGQGRFACAHPDPEHLNLASPAVELVHVDGGRSLFWWDQESKSFRRTWMSDQPQMTSGEGAPSDRSR